VLEVDKGLEEARAAFGRQAWGVARSAYASVASGVAPLTLDDIERYAIAAHLVGNDAETREALTRGYREARARDDVSRAVRFAFWLGHSMIFTGEMAQASGWWATARSLLAERGADCAEWGLLLSMEALEQFFAGDIEPALHTLDEAEAIGKRFGDADVRAGAQYLRARALIRVGRCREGVAALDQVMVALTTGELHLLGMGHTYCGLLDACWEILDLRRAREWTVALTRWCEAQPDLVPYRGPCLIHRVELMRLHGDWPDAVQEAHRACDWLSLPASPETPAEAFYQLGELRRLSGEFDEAEEAYRQASKWGRSPEPGIALLWLARGQTEAAAAALHRALDECEPNCGKRAELLGAHVEALIAKGELAAARDAASELKELAKARDAVFLHALADRAEGNVLLAEGQPGGAVALFRRSWRGWQELEAPYEGARVRVQIANACRVLGDEGSAQMELDAARWVFERLGARFDLELLDRDSKQVPPSTTGGLSARELEVLRLIAAERSNKDIAAALVISEHTVARHVQNMLQKLGCSSRTGLAAFAVEHGVVRHANG
jgi:DNA-binding CsgD family transcriptional regulator/tetratricopeptide (TPR) repeat protein